MQKGPLSWLHAIGGPDRLSHVIAPRLLLGLLQPLIALLLLAGVPLAEAGRTENGARARLIERSFKLVVLDREQAGRQQFRAQGVAERLDGDGGPVPALPVCPTPVGYDSGRALAIVPAGDDTPPPRHRACAAPPTGPPVV